MVGNIAIKPLGFVLMVTAHMVFNGHSQAEETVMNGTIGKGITLNFTFSQPVAPHTYHVGIYRTGEKKIAEYKNHSGGGVVEVGLWNNLTVSYHISNLKLNDSSLYWATLFSTALPIQSSKVKLDVREQPNTSSTDLPKPTDTTTTENNGSSSSSSLRGITVLVVSPVLLLAAALPCLIWCLVRTKGKQPQPQQTSNPTLQETIDINSASPPSVIYSVLDFPKRPSTVVEIDPNGTEYAAVSYLSEKRTMQG